MTEVAADTSTSASEDGRAVAPGAPGSPASADLGGPPHRLRDLDGRGRLVAALCGLLLLLPVGASVGRALAMGWVPSNDDALIVLQARDVFSTDPPLVGQPSTSEFYADGLAARHPGAIEFYLLAGPIRLLGPTLGTLLTAAALAGSSVLLATWIALRRVGPAGALIAAALLVGAMWSSGLSVLSDPISSNVGGFPLLAGTALAWALWCDDRRLWPVAVAVWSFTIQQHLAIFGIAGMVAAWGVAGAAAMTIHQRREVGRLASSARWAGVAVVVGLICWLGPLVDQVAGTGNLAKIIELSRHSDRPTLGLARGLRVGGRALAAPPILTTRWLADDFLAGLELIDPFQSDEAFGVAIGVGLLVLAVGVSLVRRSRDTHGDTRLALAATAVVVALAGVATASNVPDSLEAGRINLYRWMWSAAVASWAVIVWSAIAIVGPRLRGVRSRVPWLTSAGVVTVLVLMASMGLAAATRDGFGDSRRDQQVFRFEAEVIHELRTTLPPDRPVRVRTGGPASTLAVGPAVVDGLVEAGWDVRVNANREPGYGDRRARPPGPDEVEVLVLSGQGVPEGRRGERIGRVEIPVEPGDPLDVWGDDVIEVWVDVDP